MALLTPLGASEAPGPRAGLLLAFAAATEMLHGLRRSSAQGRRQASVGALISLVIAILLINAPLLAAAALLTGMAAFLLLDAIRYGVRAWRAPESSARGMAALAMAGNLVVALLLVAGHEWLREWTVAVAVALRIFGTAWNIVTSPVHTAADADETVVADLGVGDYPAIALMTASVEASEAARAGVDRAWVWSFIATLFAIHIGRMAPDGSLLGYVAPAVAVAGDMFIATLITLLMINPLYLAWRWPTRWIERPLWRWYVAQDASRPGWLPSTCRAGGCAIGCVSPCACERRAIPFERRSGRRCSMGCRLPP